VLYTQHTNHIQHALLHPYATMSENDANVDWQKILVRERIKRGIASAKARRLNEKVDEKQKAPSEATEKIDHQKLEERRNEVGCPGGACFCGSDPEKHILKDEKKKNPSVFMIDQVMEYFRNGSIRNLIDDPKTGLRKNIGLLVAMKAPIDPDKRRRYYYGMSRVEINNIHNSIEREVDALVRKITTEKYVA